MIYESVNQAVIDLVGEKSARILDLGCGTGALGGKLKTLGDYFICGVTFSEEEARLARTRLDQVLVADLNVFTPVETATFDILICSHVLEHLYQPENVLRRMGPCLRPDGRLIIALPNVLFLHQRFKFLLGRFRYTEGGLMDSTHFRFFDNVSARELPARAGYKVAQFFADGYLPMPMLRKLLPLKIARKLDQWAARSFPGLFGVQFLVVCRNTSPV